MVVTALICLPVGILIGMRQSPPIYADPEGFKFEGEVEARTLNSDGEEDNLTLRSSYTKVPQVYVSITVARGDAAAKRFAEHVEKKRKFLVRVEAAR